MNDLMRPAMYGAWMRIVECERGQGEPQALRRRRPDLRVRRLARPRPGARRRGPATLIAVLSAGAYAMSMASNYNTRGRAAEVLVSGDQAWLVRERETHRRPDPRRAPSARRR